MKILFLVPYPTEGASNRIRVEQYLSYFDSQKIIYRVRPFMSKRFYQILYLKGHYVLKICLFLKSAINRVFDIFRAISYDLIFIHREAFPIGPPFVESFIKKLKKLIIFDFDDATFLPNTSPSNIFIERFKMPSKVSKIIRLSDYVICGNEYLKNFTSKHNKNVSVIPSAIDTLRYRPQKKQSNDKVIIGWIGSITTVNFLKMLEGVFIELDKKYLIELRLVGGEFQFKGISNVVCRPWLLQHELEELHSFDIGIMPMPNNDWTKGKCGFKAILYMSVGLPCVCSPVGVNKEIIQDGQNGFLADSESEWIDKLSRLIESFTLRCKLGSAARKTIEERYSLKVNAPRLLDIIEKVYNNKNKCVVSVAF